jgi:uncharacterized surface protein with fasciclin (FAS1) repeats
MNVEQQLLSQQTLLKEFYSQKELLSVLKSDPTLKIFNELFNLFLTKFDYTFIAPFTLFVVPDLAMRQYMNVEQINMLRTQNDILFYFITSHVSQNYLTKDKLKSQQKFLFTDLNNHNALIVSPNKIIWRNGEGLIVSTNIIEWDIFCKNGIIHVINSPLV